MTIDRAKHLGTTADARIYFGVGGSLYLDHTTAYLNDISFNYSRAIGSEIGSGAGGKGGAVYAIDSDVYLTGNVTFDHCSVGYYNKVALSATDDDNIATQYALGRILGGAAIYSTSSTGEKSNVYAVDTTDGAYWKTTGLLTQTQYDQLESYGFTGSVNVTLTETGNQRAYIKTVKKTTGMVDMAMFGTYLGGSFLFNSSDGNFNMNLTQIKVTGETTTDSSYNLTCTGAYASHVRGILLDVESAKNVYFGVTVADAKNSALNTRHFQVSGAFGGTAGAYSFLYVKDTQTATISNLLFDANMRLYLQSVTSSPKYEELAKNGYYQYAAPIMIVADHYVQETVNGVVLTTFDTSATISAVTFNSMKYGLLSGAGAISFIKDSSSVVRDAKSTVNQEISYTDESSLTVKNSYFYGTGVLNNNNTEYFHDLTAAEKTAAPENVAGWKFQNNPSSRAGGAIWFNGGDLTVTSTTFDHVAATGVSASGEKEEQGGSAIYAYVTGTLTMQDLTFQTTGISSSSGGVIFVSGGGDVHASNITANKIYSINGFFCGYNVGNVTFDSTNSFKNIFIPNSGSTGTFFLQTNGTVTFSGSNTFDTINTYSAGTYSVGYSSVIYLTGTYLLGQTNTTVKSSDQNPGGSLVFEGTTTFKNLNWDSKNKKLLANTNAGSVIRFNGEDLTMAGTIEMVNIGSYGNGGLIRFWGNDLTITADSMTVDNFYNEYNSVGSTFYFEGHNFSIAGTKTDAVTVKHLSVYSGFYFYGYDFNLENVKFDQTAEAGYTTPYLGNGQVFIQIDSGARYAEQGGAVVTFDTVKFLNFEWAQASDINITGGLIRADAAVIKMDHVTVDGLKFYTKSTDVNGGAFLCASNGSVVTISDSTFTNITATNKAESGVVAARLINLRKSSLTINDSTFSGISVGSYNGGLIASWGGNVTINGTASGANPGTKFYDIDVTNSGNEITGGLIAMNNDGGTGLLTINGNDVVNGSTVIRGVQFDKIDSGSNANKGISGGLFYIASASGTVDVSGAQFSNIAFTLAANTNLKGSLLYVAENTSVSFDHVTFSTIGFATKGATDKVTVTGGAIYSYGPLTLNNVTVTGINFYSATNTNLTVTGGFAYSVGTLSLNIHHSVFSNVSAKGNGGILAIADGANIYAFNIDDSTFDTVTVTGSGGGFYLSKTANGNNGNLLAVLSVTNSSFSNFTANVSGGVFYMDGVNNALDTNSDWSGQSGERGVFTFTDVTFTNNKATGGIGGAMYVKGQA